MNITSLRLTNFRNLSDVTLDLCFGSVGFLGENAQGKTNILESLYLLSCGESWRAGVDTEFIGFDKPFARIDAVVGEDEVRLSLIIEQVEGRNGAKKSYIVNDVRRKKETFISYFPAVLFHPEDMALVTGSPAQRRKFLDEVLMQAYPFYGHTASQYAKIMTARNRILDAIREGEAGKDQLEYWTDMLVRLGAEIYQYRYRLFEFIESQHDHFTFSYMPKIDIDTRSDDPRFILEMARALRERIDENMHKEIMSATSQYGPHKDDFGLFLNGRDLSLYGSRGEQRAATFGFKKMQLLFVQEMRKTKPVLLLDDVFSEFDRAHREELSALTSGYQTFVSGTEDRFFKEEAFQFEKIYRVDSGTIQ